MSPAPHREGEGVELPSGQAAPAGCAAGRGISRRGDTLAEADVALLSPSTVDIESPLFSVPSFAPAAPLVAISPLSFCTGLALLLVPTRASAPASPPANPSVRIGFHSTSMSPPRPSVLQRCEPEAVRGACGPEAEPEGPEGAGESAESAERAERAEEGSAGGLAAMGRRTRLRRYRRYVRTEGRGEVAVDSLPPSKVDAHSPCESTSETCAPGLAATTFFHGCEPTMLSARASARSSVSRSASDPFEPAPPPTCPRTPRAGSPALRAAHAPPPRPRPSDRAGASTPPQPARGGA